MMQGNQSSTEMQAQLIERATRDPEFRRELIEDPRAVIQREFGIDVPDRVDIRVVEESPTTSYLVLPSPAPEAGQELSDEELEAVAGGWASPNDDPGWRAVSEFGQCVQMATIHPRC